MPTGPIPMRRPCHACRHALGTVTRKATQVVVRCAACGAYAYCAPKEEQHVWRRPDRPAIAPKLREAIAIANATRAKARRYS